MPGTSAHVVYLVALIKAEIMVLVGSEQGKVQVGCLRSPTKLQNPMILPSLTQHLSFAK